MTDHPVKPIVLIVEDEPILRLQAIDLCESAGFETVIATDANDAIRILENRLDIRIVFMDLDMPKGVQGIKIAAAIRDRWPPIEIILTASTFAKGQIKIPVRAVFFSKPFSEREVIETIKGMAA